MPRVPLIPLATGVALFLLNKSPASIRQPVLETLTQYLSSTHVARWITLLNWLLTAGLLRSTNALLNELAGNNFYAASSLTNWDWSNEVAVITGASSGFGRLFSLDLMAKGIRVVGLDINEPTADLADKPRFTFIKCDVTDADAVMQAAKHVQESVGHPSILINNAGIAHNTSVLKTPPKELQRLMDVNLLSHYYTIQAFVPHMIETNKGHIVSIASMASFVAAPGMLDYCIAKQGLVVLHKGLGAELRCIHNAPKVKLSIVHPTFASTPLIAGFEEKLKKMGQDIIDPQTVSDAVVKQ